MKQSMKNDRGRFAIGDMVLALAINLSLTASAHFLSSGTPRSKRPFCRLALPSAMLFGASSVSKLPGAMVNMSTVAVLWKFVNATGQAQ